MINLNDYIRNILKKIGMSLCITWAMVGFLVGGVIAVIFQPPQIIGLLLMFVGLLSGIPALVIAAYLSSTLHEDY